MAKVQLSKEDRTKIYIAFGLFIFGIVCLLRYWDLNGYSGRYQVVTRAGVTEANSPQPTPPPSAPSGSTAQGTNPVEQPQIDPQAQEQLNIADAEAKYRVVTPLTTIVADYKANEVDGDNKYRGKWVHFRGVAGNVEKDTGDHSFLYVRTTDPSSDERVPVRFDSDGLKDVANVRPDAVIDLYCQGDGKRLATPRFASCSFLSGDYVTAPYAKLQSQDSAAATDDPIYQPSFDCAKQKGAVLWLICHDADLAAADVRFNQIAQKLQGQARTLDSLTASSTNADKAKELLRDALQKRNECADVSCIASWYYKAELVFRDINSKLDSLVEQARQASSTPQ